MHKLDHQITQPRTTQALSQIFPAKFFLFLYANIVTTPQVPEKTVKQNAYEQTKEVLSLIDKLLAEIGSKKSKILTTQIFLADMTDYAQLNQAWDEWVDSQNPPSRATVEAKLADPDWKVEIVIIAAV